MGAREDAKTAAELTALSTLSAIVNDDDLFQLFYEKSVELSPELKEFRSELRETLTDQQRILMYEYANALSRAKNEMPEWLMQ